jgi:hypothetical protein
MKLCSEKKERLKESLFLHEQRYCNDAGVTMQARQEIRTQGGLTSEAYRSAWENRNLRLIDTYRSCTKGLQKTAYLHLGNSCLNTRRRES